MSDVSITSRADPETRRALELDMLAGIIPANQRDRLATILTDEDVATLRHLAHKGTGANSLRALSSDLGYLEAWAQAATGTPLPWPASEALALKFVAHHLWDLSQREQDPSHGMPEEVWNALNDAGFLKTDGRHAPSTVRRRLSTWSTLHRWKGMEAPFNAPTLKSALRLAVRATARPRLRKSKRAVTRDVLDALLATCRGVRLSDTRDRALLLLAFASGGRRRSETARLRVEQLREESPVPLDPDDPQSERLPCLSIMLGRTKTRDGDDPSLVYLVGPPVEALQFWLERSNIDKGPIFRAIDRWDDIQDTALTPQSVNLIIKRRCAKAGLDPADFSAHGLRSGYLTEAGRRGIPLPDAMQQSQHKSINQAAGYYNDAKQREGRAARLGL